MISRNDILMIQYVCENIKTLNIPANGCLYSTALLYSYLVSETNLTPKFCIGSIKISEKFLFKISESITLDLTKNQLLDWDGHAWVELGNIIIDLSLFDIIQTFEQNNFFYESIIFSFKKIPNYLIIQKDKLLQYQLDYIAVNELYQNDADILVKNISSINLV